MLTKQQLKARKAGIGGSDVDDVFNLEPYGCARRLWYDKRDYPEDYPVLINKAMERGSRMEPLIKEIFMEKYSQRLEDVPQKINTLWPFMLCNLDSLIIDNQKGHGVLEIKCSGREMFWKFKREGITEPYILQMQHNLAVWGLNWGVFFIFNADLWDWLYCEVKRDNELIEKIVEAEERFWRIVENGPTPDQLEIGDKRCVHCVYRKTCWGDLEAGFELAKDKNDVEIPDLSEDKKYVEAESDYINADDVYKEADLLRKDAKARLIKIMGDRPVVKGAGLKIYYKPSIRHSWDLKALERDHTDLKSMYQKTSIVKAFKPYRIGE